MPPKGNDAGKRNAADAFDSVINKSTKRQKKEDIPLPQPVLEESTEPTPAYIATYIAADAIRLTKADDLINFADRKIFYYGDLKAAISALKNKNKKHKDAIADCVKKIALWTQRSDDYSLAKETFLKSAKKLRRGAAAMDFDPTSLISSGTYLSITREPGLTRRSRSYLRTVRLRDIHARLIAYDLSSPLRLSSSL